MAVQNILMEQKLEKAFDEVYPVLVAGLRRALFRYGYPRARVLRLSSSEYRQLTEELADEALCRARLQLDRYEPERSPLSYWIYLLGKKLMATELDRLERWRRCRCQLEAQAGMVAEPSPGEPDELRRVHDQDRLRQALSELPEEQRRALILFYVGELSLVEVGELLEKTPEAVSSLLQRARKNARDRLTGLAPRAVGRPRKRRKS